MDLLFTDINDHSTPAPPKWSAEQNVIPIKNRENPCNPCLTFYHLFSFLNNRKNRWMMSLHRSIQI